MSSISVWSDVEKEDEVRAAVRQGLIDAGDPDAARLVESGNSLMTELPAPTLEGWRFFRFVSLPHPHAGFHVAVGAGKVLDLTARPADFAQVLRGGNAGWADTAEIAAVARLYVETTRPMTELVRVIDSVDDILLRPGLDAGEQRTRDRAVAELRHEVRPPRAGRRGDGFQVTLFVQFGQNVERRAIAIAGDGSITHDSRVIAGGLPIPYVV